jgi:hypothetical protein
LRREDPLLSYLCNARGAEEHGIADITVKTPGSVRINPAVGNRLFIEKLRIVGGRIAELISPDPVRVEVQPATFALAPVVNRGVTYPVPQSHMGGDVPGKDPITLAAAGIAFHSRVLDDIEAEFP